MGLAITTAASLALAQTTESFAGTASVKAASGMSASVPVTIEIRQFASDADRESLIAAIKSGGTSAGRDLLAKRPNVGTIQLGSRSTPIRYAYARTTGAGRLITVVTAEPILFVGLGVPDTKPKAGYDLGLAIFDVNPSQPGQGEISPAAKVKVDAQNAIVTEDYGVEMVRITGLTKK